MRVFRLSAVLCAALSLLIEPLVAAGPPWKLTLAEGKTAVSLGFLAQPQFEALEKPNASGHSNNLFLRRFRLIAGGKINSKLSFFVESDAANLGKQAADGTRTKEFYLQDAYLTYAFRPEFQLDGGMLLVPVSHNSQQSGASLLPVDYGPYSFLSSDPAHCKVGRDYGLEARGYIRKHFEYRLGAFRGHRDSDASFPFRYAGRLVWYPFDVDSGFFYTGTTVGQKRIFALGTSFDRQGHYSSNAVDLFIDQPLKGGGAVTLQADYIRYNGRETFPMLPQQNAWIVEGSYYIRAVKLGPYIQAASRNYTEPGLADDKKVQGGLIYWARGHRLNIKMGVGRLLKDGAPDRFQFVLQTQLFYY